MKWNHTLLSFPDWFSLLNIMSPRLISYWNRFQNSLPFQGWITFHHMHIPISFICSSANGHSGSNVLNLHREPFTGERKWLGNLAPKEDHFFHPIIQLCIESNTISDKFIQMYLSDIIRRHEKKLFINWAILENLRIHLISTINQIF